jgi:regulator of replication initiation timing
LQQHYLSEQHQKSVVRCVQQIIESNNGDSSKADIDIEEGKTSLFEAYERLSITTKDIETNHDELLRLDDEIFRCRNQIVTLPEQLNNTQIEISLQKAHIDAISLNQNVLKQDTTNLRQQIENEDEIIKQEPDGTMVWRITNVQEKMYDAQSERQTSIYSPAFYTSISGYKVCARLYLNGDGSARGSHISIFLVILRGQYDSLLKWPFSFRVSFCLCDQRTMIEKNGTIQPKHIIESFRPDINSISFQRPSSAMNIASGIPKFFLLSELNRPTNENLYIVDDTMYIKTLIDFIGMPRSILPFIFNLNIAFPPHIRHKLILDEIKRREEQNTN